MPPRKLPNSSKPWENFKNNKINCWQSKKKFPGWKFHHRSTLITIIIIKTRKSHQKIKLVATTKHYAKKGISFAAKTKIMGIIKSNHNKNLSTNFNTVIIITSSSSQSLVWFNSLICLEFCKRKKKQDWARFFLRRHRP